MIINPKALKKKLKTARVSENYVVRELAEPNFFKYDEIELDLEQTVKLLQIFTATEVISAMRYTDKNGLIFAMRSGGICKAY